MTKPGWSGISAPAGWCVQKESSQDRISKPSACAKENGFSFPAGAFVSLSAAYVLADAEVALVGTDQQSHCAHGRRRSASPGTAPPRNRPAGRALPRRGSGRKIYPVRLPAETAGTGGLSCPGGSAAKIMAGSMKGAHAGAPLRTDPESPL